MSEGRKGLDPESYELGSLKKSKSTSDRVYKSVENIALVENDDEEPTTRAPLTRKVRNMSLSIDNVRHTHEKSSSSSSSGSYTLERRKSSWETNGGPKRPEGKLRPSMSSRVSGWFRIKSESDKSSRKGLRHQRTVSAITSHPFATSLDLSEVKKISRSPHHFSLSSVTALKTLKCTYCGEPFKGIMLKVSKCQDCGFTCHPLCGPNVPPHCIGKGSKKSRKKEKEEIFGTELSELDNTEGIPWVIRLCTEAVEKRGLEIEGIYRLSGANTQVNKLKSAFVHGVPDLDSNEWMDISVITSILKQFFRELPTSLIPIESYASFLSIAKLSSEEEIVRGLNQFVRDLPPIHYLTLKYMIEHLIRVSDKKDVNKMTPKNLSILFGPTFFRAENTQKDMEDMYDQAKVVERLIIHYKGVFVNEDCE